MTAPPGDGPTGMPAVAPAAAVEPRPPTTTRLAMWWVLAVGLALGLWFAATTHPLRATITFGTSCVVAALLRALLPPARAGGLVVRSRWFDVATLVFLGVVVVVVGRSMNLHPHV